MQWEDTLKTTLLCLQNFTNILTITKTQLIMIIE